jgi:hypothetical protein
MIALLSLGFVFMAFGCAHEQQSAEMTQMQEQLAQKDQVIQ